MTDQSNQDALDKAERISELRDALQNLESAKSVLYSTSVSSDHATLDHAASQYVLAKQRVGDAIDALDSDSLDGVTAQREATADDETTEPAPSVPDGTTDPQAATPPTDPATPADGTAGAQTATPTDPAGNPVAGT